MGYVAHFAFCSGLVPIDLTHILQGLLHWHWGNYMSAKNASEAALQDMV